MKLKRETLHRETESTRFLDLVRSGIYFIYGVYIFCFIYTPFLLASGLIISYNTGLLNFPDRADPHFAHVFTHAIYRFMRSFSGLQLLELSGIACLMLATIYLLKGIMIGLRIQRRPEWKILYVTCIVLTCLVPAWMAELSIYSLITLTGATGRGYVAFSWVMSVLPAYLIYRKYQFSKDTCPPIVSLVYSAGINLIPRVEIMPEILKQDAKRELIH